MTRRGSIVYYMTAVVFGTFFLATTFYLYDIFIPRVLFLVYSGAFLQSYFSLLVVFTFPLLIGAFVLRRAARVLHLKSMFAWLAVGTITFVAIDWTLAALSKVVEGGGGEFDVWRVILFSLLTYGPKQLVGQRLWVAPLQALATTYMLFVVFRAFELQPAAPPSAEPRS